MAAKLLFSTLYVKLWCYVPWFSVSRFPRPTWSVLNIQSIYIHSQLFLHRATLSSLFHFWVCCWWFFPFYFQYPGTAYDADDYVNVVSSLWTSLRLISLSGISRRMETILKRAHTLIVMLHWPSKGIYTYSVIQLHSSLYFFPLLLN